MLRAIELLRAEGLRLEGDVLVYRQNAVELPEIVRLFHERGLTRFFVWLLAAGDVDAEEVQSAVPRIAEVMPHLVAAMDLGLSPEPDFITSLHTPPCTVPVSHHRALFFATDLKMVVVNPGGHSFPLETSPIEGGLYTPRWAQCRMRPRCGGFREGCAKRFGDEEFQPLL